RSPEGHKGNFDDQPAEDNVILLGDKTRDADQAQIMDTPLHRTFNEIRQIDRNFDPTTFVQGAQSAYEAVVVAFARGDRETLRILLSEKVYENFDASIQEREDRHETMSSDIVAIRGAEITDATLVG